jgi:hypothetical protein
MRPQIMQGATVVVTSLLGLAVIVIWGIYVVCYPVMIADNFFDPNSALFNLVAWSSWEPSTKDAAEGRSIRHGLLDTAFHRFAILQVRKEENAAMRTETGVESYRVKWSKLLPGASLTLCVVLLPGAFLYRRLRRKSAS